MHALECERWFKYHNLLLTVTNQPSPLHFWVPHWWSSSNKVFSENADMWLKITYFTTVRFVKSSHGHKKWRTFRERLMEILKMYFCSACYPSSVTALSGEGKDLKLVLFVFCYFAHCSPRGSVDLHFLDEQLRKIVPYFLFLKNLDEKILIYTSWCLCLR